MRLTAYTRALIVYLALLLLWFLTWLTLGDATWILALTNRGAVPFLFVPAILFLLIGILRRHYRATLLLIIPALIFLALYSPYVIPRLVTTTTAPALTVLTYNVLFSNKNYDAVANNILTYKPDLIALQEVQPEMFAALTERLRAEYPYSLMATENKFGTPAIFSRTRFTAQTILDLQADRPAVIIQTNIQNHPITFASTHFLAFNLGFLKLQDIPPTTMQWTYEQNRQAQILLDQVVASSTVHLIACDCNSYETSSTFRLLSSKMTSASRAVGWRLNAATLPDTHQDTDLNHIDHILYDNGIRPTDTFVIQDSGGSDHLPVIARFTFAP